MAMDTPCRCRLDTRAFPKTSGFCPATRAGKWESPNFLRAPRQQLHSSRRYANAKFLPLRSRFRSIQKYSFVSLLKKDSIHQLTFDLFQCFALGFGQFEFNERK